MFHVLFVFPYDDLSPRCGLNGELLHDGPHRLFEFCEIGARLKLDGESVRLECEFVISITVEGGQVVRNFERKNAVIVRMSGVRWSHTLHIAHVVVKHLHHHLKEREKENNISISSCVRE